MPGMCLAVVAVAAMSVVGGGSATTMVRYRSKVGHRPAVQCLGCMDLSDQFHV
jgi:hypothetical protein